MLGRIVADSQGAAQLNSGDSPLVSSTQIDSPEPDGQGQSGTVHNGTGSDRGLMTTGAALEGITAMDGIILPASTDRADEAVGKSQPEQFFSASLFCAVPNPKLFETNRCSLCHNDYPLAFWVHYRISAVQYLGQLQDMVACGVKSISRYFL